MRVLILALSVAVSVLGILASADATKAGPSTTTRDLSASLDPAAVADDATLQSGEATRQTEDRIGLDKRKRSDVQRRLTSLGFDTKVNGKFDKRTRAVIMRWQAARDYPSTGFLNTLQHQALLSESVSAAQASPGGDKPDGDRPARRRGGTHRSSGGGGPIGVIGGVVGGLFGRR
jgi:peptidoglycan hydrolase-like protein with peptidoglycan-binding domain